MNYQRIRSARKDAKKSQDDLATLLGVNRATVSKYETGVIEPSVSQLLQISKYLGVDFHEFLDDEAPMFQVGDSYFGGNLIVSGVEHDDSERVTVTFHVNNTGMKPEELMSLFKLIDTFSKDHGMSVGGLAQLAEAASKAAKEIADNHLQSPLKTASDTETDSK